jgi:hypothetical protein
MGMLGQISEVTRDLIVAASGACLTVGIAIAILISESLRDGSPLSRAGVLLRSSGVLPILCGTLSAVALATIGAFRTAVGIGIVVVIVAATIASLYRLVALMLDPVKLSSARTALEHDLLAAAARSTVEDRVADNVVSRELVPNAAIVRVLGPSWIPARARGTSFKAEVSGFVEDVRLAVLNKICAIMRGALARAQSAPAPPIETGERSIAALAVRIGEWIEAGADVLSVSSRLSLTRVERVRLSDLCNQLCVMRAGPTSAQTLELLVANIESELGKAIDESDFPKTMQLCETLRNVVEEHLRCMTAIGATFGHKETQRELGTFGRRLQIAREVPDTVQRVIARAVRVGDAEIAREVTALPTIFVHMAMRAGDLLVLESFVGVHSSLSQMYFEEEGVSPRIRRLLWDRAWRHLRETGQYVWGALLEKASEPEIVGRLSEAAREIAKAFQELLKTCIDRRALDEFEDALTALGRIVPKHELEEIEHRAMMTRLTGRANSTEQQAVDPLLIAKENAYRDVLRANTQVVLGLIAWLDRAAVGAGETGADVQGQMRLRLLNAMPREFGILLDAYIDATLRERSENLGWDRWILAEMPEGVASFVSMEINVARGFVDAALGSDLALELDAMPEVTMQVAGLFRPGGEVEVAMNERSPGAEDATPGAEALRQKIERLRTASAAIRQAGERAQIEREQAATIEESMVLAFVAGVRLGYVGSGVMRSVLGGVGGVESRELGPRDPTLRLRVAQRTFKGLFSRADLEAVYADEPERWGANLARAVDEHLFKEVATELLADEQVVLRDDVDAVFREIDEMTAQGCHSVTVITTAVMRVSAMMWHRQEFRRREGAGLNEGVLTTPAGNEARIFALYGVTDREKTLIVCDPTEPLVWESAWTPACEEDRWRVGNPVRVRVTDLARDEAFRTRIVEGASGTEEEKQKLDQDLSREASVEIEVAVGRLVTRPVRGKLLHHLGQQ